MPPRGKPLVKRLAPVPKTLIPAQKRISRDEWEAQRENFTRLYIEDGMNLQKCMELMEANHGFIANKKQYLRKIRMWNIDKNIKRPEMRVALRKTLERMVAEGKDTTIEVRGVVIDKGKLKRFLRREIELEEERKQKVVKKTTSNEPQAEENKVENAKFGLRIYRPVHPSDETDAFEPHSIPASLWSNRNADSWMHSVGSMKRPKREKVESLGLRPSWKIPTPGSGYKVYTPLACNKGLYTPGLCDLELARAYKEVDELEELWQSTFDEFGFRPFGTYDKLWPDSTRGAGVSSTGSRVHQGFKKTGEIPSECFQHKGHIICGRYSETSAFQAALLTNYLFTQYQYYLKLEKSLDLPYEQDCRNVLGIIAKLCLNFLNDCYNPADRHAAVVRYNPNDTNSRRALELVDFCRNTTCPFCKQEIKLSGEAKDRSFGLPPGIPWPVYAYADIHSERALKNVYTKLVLVASTTQSILNPDDHESATPLEIVYPQKISDSSFGTKVTRGSALIDGDTTTYGSTTVRWKPSFYENFSLSPELQLGIDPELSEIESQTINDISTDLSASLEFEPNFDEFMTWLDMNELRDEEIADEQQGRQKHGALSELIHARDFTETTLDTEKQQARVSQWNALTVSGIQTSDHMTWLQLDEILEEEIDNNQPFCQDTVKIPDFPAFFKPGPLFPNIINETDTNKLHDRKMPDYRIEDDQETSAISEFLVRLEEDEIQMEIAY
ncbi:hypothetical protein H072_1765 [Dactylellina haptotyla CBS 200.50]|uniref:Clr5 domain-containing protein n=1 Tax=Dactylellina haptotyla (strain CBS 200.50) TaxID=1284197 RepID=S8BXJ5_DACHA|nr:hypothetical protein H072_1765 [Dactylellina haptotyla CBS 200.50]